MRSPSQARLTQVLGAGALLFGVLGVVRPASLARMLGSSDETARGVGFRDLGNALVLFALRDPGPGIAQRMLYDLSDAYVFGRRKPAVAAAALGFAALGALALAAD